MSLGSNVGKGVFFQLALLRKENEALKAKLSDKASFARQTELEDKLKERDLEIAGLKKELRSMQRIQDGQGKALKRVIEDNEYTLKIQTLVEELRVAREKIVKLEEKAAREERNCSAAHERMIMLEERCRDLNRVLKERKAENMALMVASREASAVTP
jgi:uncharacterized coiled-coil DUF342 family protein